MPRKAFYRRLPSKAQLAKREGMTKSEARADRAWSAVMLVVARNVARRMRVFTSDDVIAAYRGPLRTHDERALGPVMLNAAKAGYCELADVAPINSERETLHASPRQVWKSKIYEGG